MKIRRIFLITLSVLVFFTVFILDILRKSSFIDKVGIFSFRNILIVIGFLIIFFLLNRIDQTKEKSIVTKIGNVLLLSAGLLVSLGLVSFIPGFQFHYHDFFPTAGNYLTVIFSDIFSILSGIWAVYLLVIIKNLIFSYRRKETKRNFIIVSFAIIIFSIYFFIQSSSQEASLLNTILYILTILTMLINSFRLPWIVYLSKKEKYYSIAYYLLILPLIITATVVNGGGLMENNSSRMLFFFSPLLKHFIFFISIFTSIYFGIAFISTIFHIPTQDIFDRKIIEISSLHNLSKLVTQIFDFKDLIENITRISLEVSEADCAWIEIKKEPKSTGISSDEPAAPEFELVGYKNINRDEILSINSISSPALRDSAIQNRKVYYLNNLSNNLSDKNLEGILKKIRSLVVVPLVSHSEIIGVLYIGKSFSYGFDKEYLNIINTFADQVTISIENSKLIEKSLEKERMERELLLAQKMQRKLLPNSSPEHESIDLSAVSIPAYEVGGDYYDFSKMPENQLGIIVGDVSGKGISAAFYMAVIKGVFQSLAKIFLSPKEFLINANLAINGNIEKNSFVSIVYGILDLNSGALHLSRAGHCPMIYICNSEAKYIKPDGLAVGLDNGKIFNNIMEEITLNMENNSVCIFYTDGITEARNRSNEEYGCNRLLESAKKWKDKSSKEIADGILADLKEFTENENEYDDLTLVCLKWRGKK